MIEQSRRILNSVYGFKDFLPAQERVIQSVLSGKDTLALLPTGGGKSICYQIPALQQPGICIVISPLIALIKDQVHQLKKRGIKAIGLTGAIQMNELDNLLDNAIYGGYKFLYCSPERLKHPLVQQRIAKMQVNLIAVDEAHCISEWGNDFRPAYRDIVMLKKWVTNAPMIALTATATAAVQQDICQSLALEQPDIHKNSFKRSNISYHIIDTANKRQAIASFYKTYPGCSIAYVRSRKNCYEYAQYLEQNGIAATHYHGGLDIKQRDTSMQRWMRDEQRVMVATNAFGMGIDKPDVRTIVHLQVPDSIESYYQETGRAGRDGKSSRAQFIYNVNDLNHAHNQFVKNLPSVPYVKQVYRHLCNYLHISLNEGMEEQFQFSFSSFCKHNELNAVACYNALHVLDRYGVLKMEQGTERKSSIRFRESAKNINQYTSNNTTASSIMQAILRAYGSSQEQDIVINIGLIAVRSNSTEKQVITVLKKMHQQEVIEANLQTEDTQVLFLVPRENDRTINRFSHLLERQNNLKKRKLEQMMQFVQEREECLQNYILSYFDEPARARCGHCSNCVRVERTAAHDSFEILKFLKSSRSFNEIAGACNWTDDRLVTKLRMLIESGKVQITDDNKYKINE